MDDVLLTNYEGCVQVLQVVLQTRGWYTKMVNHLYWVPKCQRKLHKKPM